MTARRANLAAALAHFNAARASHMRARKSLERLTELVRLGQHAERVPDYLALRRLLVKIAVTTAAAAEAHADAGSLFASARLELLQYVAQVDTPPVEAPAGE